MGEPGCAWRCSDRSGFLRAPVLQLLPVAGHEASWLVSVGQWVWVLPSAGSAMQCCNLPEVVNVGCSLLTKQLCRINGSICNDAASILFAGN